MISALPLRHVEPHPRDAAPVDPAIGIDSPPLLALARWRRAGLRACLLTIVAIDGRSPRSVGAQMAVSAAGETQGYLSGGCVERELAGVARTLIGEGRNDLRRYGKGSPWIDLRLPCGSGIDVYFDTRLTDGVLFEAEARLRARTPFALRTDLATGRTHIAAIGCAPPPHQERKGDLFDKIHLPPPRLRILGSGQAAIQLALLATAAGIEAALFCEDEATAAQAEMRGLAPRALDDAGPADPWTASVLLFHDHDREAPALRALLDQPGFYIGAVGSRTVIAARRATLAAQGRTDLTRLHMPAGLVRRARSATEMAAGILAEILDTARDKGLVT